MRDPGAPREGTRRAVSHAPDRLRLVRQQRAPFVRLADRLIREGLESFVPEAGTVAEIGSGDGWLRERMPEELRSRAVHTEPLPAAIEGFARNHAGAVLAQASAEALPFADGELSAIVGCCVLDMVEDGPRVAREAARVLRPGAAVMHWLDLSTRLNEIFAQLARSTLIPIPNVFSDPSAAHWPEDLFLVQRQELGLVLEVLARHRHPLSEPLGQYLAVFCAEPFSLRAAIAEFVQLVESAELRRALRSLFKVAHELADADLRPRMAAFFGRPVSSARHFESRLRHWFLPQAGFRVELSDVVRAWELAPREQFLYESSCVGEQRQLTSLPEVLLCPDANLPVESQSLRELGIFVFVARRC
jgi:SAM-dependent methyltransferase